MLSGQMWLAVTVLDNTGDISITTGSYEGQHFRTQCMSRSLSSRVSKTNAVVSSPWEGTCEDRMR